MNLYIYKYIYFINIIESLAYMLLLFA